MKKITKKYVTDLTYKIIGAAIDVHKELGSGLLENVYEACLVYELESKGLSVKRQHPVPIKYKGAMLETTLQCDLLIENCIVVELKAVMKMVPLFDAQVMTYARLLEMPKAILINFMSGNIFHEGQKTFVNKYFQQLPEA